MRFACELYVMICVEWPVDYFDVGLT